MTKVIGPKLHGREREKHLDKQRQKVVERAVSTPVRVLSSGRKVWGGRGPKAEDTVHDFHARKIDPRTDRYLLTLPKILVEHLGWKPGDEVWCRLAADDKGLVILKAKPA